MTIKGYMFLSKVVAIEGADNHVRPISDHTIPLAYSSIMAGDLFAKSAASSSAIEAVRLASEKERSQLYPVPEKEIDGTGVADLLSELQSKIRNGEMSIMNLSKVNLGEQIHIVIDVKRKS